MGAGGAATVGFGSGSARLVSLLDTATVDVEAAPADRGSRARAPAATWSRRTSAFGLAGLALYLAGMFLFWRLSDLVVPWDSKNHFYPMFRFLADALRHGTVPLWNPYHFAGYPAVADPQSLIFTPSMVLFALVAPDASMPVFDAVILAHLFVGGAGVLALARRWNWYPAAGLLTALVFTFGGAASGRLEHTGMIISYIYFPWALWGLQAALSRRSLRWAGLTGLFVALMALGRDQVAFTLCLCLLGCVVHQALESRRPLAFLLARSPVLACAGLVTLACMIVPILLTLQFVHDSNRPSITYGVALAGSLNPINLLTLVAPNVFGSLDHVYDYWGPGTGLIAGNDWTDKTDRTMDYMFIGTVPFVLLVWHGLGAGRLLARGPRFFAALFAFALVYALGRYTPFFGVIFDWVPGVSRISSDVPPSPRRCSSAPAGRRRPSRRERLPVRPPARARGRAASRDRTVSRSSPRARAKEKGCSRAVRSLLPRRRGSSRRCERPPTRTRVAVDEASGTFDYDCSGFLDYALIRVLPAHYRELTAATEERPLAQDFVTYFTGDTTSLPADWMRVTRVVDLVPGDILSWLAVPDDFGDTGARHDRAQRSRRRPEPRRCVRRGHLGLDARRSRRGRLARRTRRWPGHRYGRPLRRRHGRSCEPRVVARGRRGRHDDGRAGSSSLERTSMDRNGRSTGADLGRQRDGTPCVRAVASVKRRLLGGHALASPRPRGRWNRPAARLVHTR